MPRTKPLPHRVVLTLVRMVAPHVERCAACGKTISKGDAYTILPLGPGDDMRARARCVVGQSYDPVYVNLHWACATGDVS